MIRKLVVVLLIGVMVLVLGCLLSTTGWAKKTEISVMWRTSLPENKMIDEVIASFEKKNPDIKVKTIFVAWAEYEPKLLTLFAGGIAPDVLGTGGTNPFCERFLRGMVLDLKPLLEKELDLLKDIYPETIKTYTIGGHLVGIPTAVCPAGCFYNATLFDNAGLEYPPVDWTDENWTWDKMVEVAKRLTKDINGDGKIDQFGISQPTDTFYLTRIWGGDLVSDEDYREGVVHKLATDDPKNYSALLTGVQKTVDLIYKDKVGLTPVTATTLNQMGGPLRSGRVAMVPYSGAWEINPPLPKKYTYGFAASPLAATRGKLMWIDIMQIPKTTKHLKEAWKFIKYFSSDEESLEARINLRVWTSVPNLQSARTPFLETIAPLVINTVSELEQVIDGCIKQAKSTDPQHILVGWPWTRDIFMGELDPVWAGKRSPKEAIDILIPKINKVLKEKVEKWL